MEFSSYAERPSKSFFRQLDRIIGPTAYCRLDAPTLAGPRIRVGIGLRHRNHVTEIIEIAIGATEQAVLSKLRRLSLEQKAQLAQFRKDNCLEKRRWKAQCLREEALERKRARKEAREERQRELEGQTILLNDTDLPPRVKRYGLRLTLLSDFTKFTRKEVSTWRNFGSKSLRDLTKCLHSYGLDFKAPEKANG